MMHQRMCNGHTIQVVYMYVSCNAGRHIYCSERGWVGGCSVVVTDYMTVQPPQHELPATVSAGLVGGLSIRNKALAISSCASQLLV